jgi:putative acetyltransferase
MTPNVEIKEATAEDAQGVYAVTAAAFGGEDEAKLIVALAEEDAIVLALAAKLEGVVIGAVIFSRVRLEAADGASPAVALAPLAVAPAFQRRGLGSLLVREGLVRLAAMGERFALVLGDHSYYGRFGFAPQTAAMIDTPWNGPHMQGLALGGAAPPAACRAVYAAAFALLA